MIEAPTIGSRQLGRKDEAEEVADYAVQLLVEEAQLVGWQREEFLAAIIESASARLPAVAVGNEPELPPPANDWPSEPST